MGNDYIRIHFGNTKPDIGLQFKFMKVVGEFRGSVVEHAGAPTAGGCYITS